MLKLAKGKLASHNTRTPQVGRRENILNVHKFTTLIYNIDLVTLHTKEKTGDIECY